MPNEIAIGLFRTFGDAEDVRNRLVYDGTPAADIELRRLAKHATIPPQDTPQTMLSFMDWLFGDDLPEKYGVHVTNGETAVCVRTRSEEEMTAALDTMRQYAPLELDRVAPPDEEPFLDKERQQAAKTDK
jgi:hypothetical protein